MERLPKENYYQPTLATLAPAKKPDFPPSSSSGSETVMTADDRAHSANQVSDGRVNAGKYRTLRRHAREYHNQRNITEGGCFYFSSKSREEDLLVSGLVLGKLGPGQLGTRPNCLGPTVQGPNCQEPLDYHRFLANWALDSWVADSWVPDSWAQLSGA